MMTKSKGKGGELLIDAAATALDAATGTPAGTLLRSGGALVSNFLTRIGDERARKAYATFLEQWALIADLPKDEARERVSKLLTEGDPVQDHHLNEMFRHMAFSRGDAAWPYIARMTTQYGYFGIRPDTFFRRCGWLLERTEDMDVELLVGLVIETNDLLREERCQTAASRGTYNGVMWRYEGADDEDDGQIRIAVNIQDIPSGEPHPIRVVHASEQHRDLLLLVEQSRLAERDVRDRRITFRAQYMDRLVRLFAN